eukprot:tig00020806_g14035.t1
MNHEEGKTRAQERDEALRSAAPFLLYRGAPIGALSEDPAAHYEGSLEDESKPLLKHLARDEETCVDSTQEGEEEARQRSEGGGGAGNKPGARAPGARDAHADERSG